MKRVYFNKTLKKKNGIENQVNMADILFMLTDTII